MKKLILISLASLMIGITIGFLIGNINKTEDSSSGIKNEFYYCKVEKSNLLYPVWVKTEPGQSPEYYAAEKTFEIYDFMPHDFMITCEKR